MPCFDFGTKLVNAARRFEIKTILTRWISHFRPSCVFVETQTNQDLNLYKKKFAIM